MTSESRRLFLVTGSESSGTRWLTSGLIMAGCTGDPGHQQRFDVALDASNHSWPERWPAVVRRSFPHGEGWPDLSDLQRRVRDRFDATMTVVAIHRDFADCVRSKIRHGNCSLSVSEGETRFGFDELARQLGGYAGETAAGGR